jgi:TonB-linked SusC/RagA family outer membrane protein
MGLKFYSTSLKKIKISLIFFLSTTFCQQALAQNRAAGTIKGMVTDGTGAALPGANVAIEGKAIGTTASPEGKYSISVPEGSYTMVISYIGFNPVKIPVKVTAGQEQVFNRSLVGNTQLEEITVSYGKQRQREVTGSISQINATTLQDMPVNQFAQQLQGKAAGVQVAQSSGQPGRGVEFRIRGAASLHSSNQPLFVVDGVPVTGSINNINPSEIESFSILKDASASALYGSRAANGVVLITTKHAKPGDSKIEFNSNYGIQTIPGNKVPDMMTAREFATFMKERAEDRIKYEANKAPVDPAYANPEQYGDGTNWYDLLTRSAPIQSYNLSVQSARERSSSTVMAGYQDQQGVLINTGTKLFSLRMNHDISLSNNKLRLGFNLAPSYRRDHNNRLATDGVGGLFERVFEASPLVSPFDANGAYNVIVSSPGMVNYINPLAQFNLSKDDYITTRILGNAYLNYEFLDGLTLKTNIGADKGNETRSQFTPSIITTNSVATGISSSVDNFSWTAEANLDYHKTFAKDHNLQALVGYSIQKFEGENNSVSGTGFPSDDVPYLSAATSITAGSSTNSQYAMLSTIARLNYDYKGKYLLQGAVRSDGSSRFGENRRYGTFPSVSVGWVISEENFMKDVKFIDFLKVRASYGITGNNNFGNFDALARVGEYNYILNGALASGQSISQLGNTELEWERNKQFDIGLDLTMFANRVSFTYDYYRKTSDGLLQQRPIPRASGFSSILFNIGEFEFWGHEFTLNTTNTTGKLQWNTNFNLSIDRNKIKNLVSPGFIRRNNTVSSDYYRNQIGHSLGEFYGFIFEGLYKDEADLANSARYGSASDVGTIKMRDINNDGVIDDVNDRTFIGDPTPDFTFGMTNNFNYGNFDLSISLSGSVGGQILNAAKWAYQTNMDGSRMLLSAAADRWRSPENPGSGVYPRTKTGTTAIGRAVNSQWIENGSYLNVNNIALGYKFGLKDKLLLKNLRVFASVQQAFVITGYSGMNPQINFAGLDPTQGIGVDENAYPVPRTFSIGLSTTFR